MASRANMPKDHLQNQWLMPVLHFLFCHCVITLPCLTKEIYISYIFQKLPQQYFRSHILFQKLATTPSRCGITSLLFESVQTFPSFAQGSVVEVHVFSLWVKCGLRNGFSWPMWRFSEFRCIVK